jgi:hypothetical protein
MYEYQPPLSSICSVKRPEYEIVLVMEKHINMHDEKIWTMQDTMILSTTNYSKLEIENQYQPLIPK